MLGENMTRHQKVQPSVKIPQKNSTILQWTQSLAFDYGFNKKSCKPSNICEKYIQKSDKCIILESRKIALFDKFQTHPKKISKKLKKRTFF